MTRAAMPCSASRSAARRHSWSVTPAPISVTWSSAPERSVFEPPTGGPGGFLACLGRHGIREAITYQPAGRYWRFQWTETAIYLILALALTGYCFRRINRRLS